MAMTTLAEHVEAARPLLLADGHSMAKAMEIELDAKRGDKYALNWLAALRARESKP